MKKEDFKTAIATAVSKATGLALEEATAQVSVPPRADMGDYAFPCFALAKSQKKAPPAVATELSLGLAGTILGVETVEAAGPFVNFRLDRARFTEAVLREAALAGPAYGRSNEGAGKVVAIDYSSPNIAKPFHVGHLRSTIIGGALYRLFSALGYQCVGINHLGDWGTQFGKQIVGLKRWGKPEDLKDLMALNHLYAKFHTEEAAHPELAEEAREWFRKQEAGDPEALALWQQIRDTSLDYFKRIYTRLGVQFDTYTGESFFNDKMEPIVAEATAKKLATESDGALIIDLERVGIKTPALLKKADGATLYLTRDLAAARYRHATYRFHKLLYVVGTAQSLHFQQLFATLKLLGDDWARDCVHVNFGLVLGMQSRKGEVIYLEALLDEARARALKAMRETIEKRAEVDDEEAVAEAVGIAAIFFADMSKQRVRDYEFDWQRALAFEGDTGPYLLSAHARIAGIIRKCGIEIDPGAELSPLIEPEAYALVKLIGRYPEVLREAARLHEPSTLATYLLDLAHGLHSGYQILRVKDEELKVARARLLLFNIVKNVLASGLGILGIPALERM